MLKRLIVLVVLLSVSFVVEAKKAEQVKIEHVIYVTLDGVRWQDVLQSHQHFSILWQRYADNMTVYGLSGGVAPIEVASIPVSLPSYQSQMTGAVQPCQVNECGRVKVETMPEYLRSTLKLRKRDVAVFSSWPVIDDALESHPGAVYSNVGNIEVLDPVSGKPDAVMKKINRLQTLHHHVKTNRLDAYTFAHALHYFQKYQPVFMWISLVNADNEAHMNHPKRYYQMLTAYDQYLDQLMTVLSKMKLDKNTMVVITTDHGRGDGQDWTSHGGELPASKSTWAFVLNGQLKPVTHDGKTYRYNTLSIRPTIEAALIH